MIGAKSGDRVAVIGAGEPDLAAELALVTGLNGETTVVADAPGASARVEAAAVAAGALVAFLEAGASPLPFGSESHDIVVFLNLAGLDAATRAAALPDALRVLRPSGRVVLVDGTRRSGLFGGPKVPRLEPAAVLAALATAGARAQRLLADVEGVAFYEARR
jgi:ubiquinone/menaquinone biosynthesis C-methylase UbiE